MAGWFSPMVCIFLFELNAQVDVFFFGGVVRVL